MQDFSESDRRGLMGWLAERLDEVFGEFEIPIEIEDGDLTQAGNQPIKMTFANLAEAIAEIATMNLQQTMNSELLLNIVNRTMIEVGASKQQDFKTYMAVMSIVEYLGFPFSEFVERMPLLFTPGEDTFDKILQETQVDVPVIDYREKSSLGQQMQDLLQAAAIIRAVYFKRVNPQNAKEQIKAYLKQLKSDELKDEDLDKLALDLDSIE